MATNDDKQHLLDSPTITSKEEPAHLVQSAAPYNNVNSNSPLPSSPYLPLDGEENEATPIVTNQIESSYHSLERSINGSRGSEREHSEHLST